MSCQGAASQPLVRLGARPPVLDVPEVRTEGFLQRMQVFGSAVEFFAPGLKRWQTREWKPRKARAFLPVSVTGTACALSCDHCETKVLQGMMTVPKEGGLFELASRLRDQGTEGILVSGGSTKSGEVPLEPHLEDMGRIREELGLKVIVHSGVILPEIARGLAEARVDGVMIDVIGADETISEVYHLDLRAEDFDRSLALLASEGLTILPHIVLGLHYGRFVGEDRALEMIARYPVSTLILVVLTPLSGTPMEHLPTPPTEEIVAFFAKARSRMPDTRINLGCGRPMGSTKVVLDKAAIDHGLNGIAYPAEGIVDYARNCGLDPELYEYCCSLTWSDA